MYLLAVNPSNSGFIYPRWLYFIAYLLSKFKLGIWAQRLECHLEKVTFYHSLQACFKTSRAWSQSHEFAKPKLLVKPLKTSIIRVFFNLSAVILITLPWSSPRRFNQWQSREELINLQSSSCPLFISAEYLWIWAEQKAHTYYQAMMLQYSV